MKNAFSRQELLVGSKAMETLKNAKVAVFGLGGVGSFVSEALARSGIGSFVLVDSDTVDITNINRQLIATHETLGRAKVDVMRERILTINPDAKIETHQVMFLPPMQGLIDGCDYVADAIDTVTAKLALIAEANEKRIPIISCMGTGNKLNPSKLCVSDIYSTSVCPLCRVMRHELRRRNIDSLKVIFSSEEPVKLQAGAKSTLADPSIPGSIAFVPPVAGMLLAGEIVRDLLKIKS